jgi:hypothetical protein
LETVKCKFGSLKLKKRLNIIKNLICTSQITLWVCVIKAKHLMLFREIVDVYCQNFTKHVSCKYTVCKIRRFAECKTLSYMHYLLSSNRSTSVKVCTYRHKCLKFRISGGFLALRPNAGYDLILKVSKSHRTTHHSR